MKARPLRYILRSGLIIPLALLAANCSSSSDSTTSEDPTPEDYAAEDRKDTRDDGGDSRSDSQNSQGFWRETDNQQSFGQDRAAQITAGSWHSCALRQTGTITCWGHNEYRQLGDGAFLLRDVVGFGG